MRKFKILKWGMKGSLTKSLKDLDDFWSKATSDLIEGKRLTITKSLTTYENYAEKIYGLLSTTDEVEEEMSNDLAYIEDVNTSLAKLSSHPGKVSGLTCPSFLCPPFQGIPQPGLLSGTYLSVQSIKIKA